MMTWLAPVLALVGALIGSIVAPWLLRKFDENAADRALIFEAIDAVSSAQLRRFNATGFDAATLGLTGDLAVKMSNDLRQEWLKNFVSAMNNARLKLLAVYVRRPLETWRPDTGWEIGEREAPLILDELRDILREQNPLRRLASGPRTADHVDGGL